MTISTTDLKIYKSQRNRDTDDGGGAMSPNLVVNGELNNVFDNISSEDRVTGRVSILKIYPGVFSDNTDKFYGAGLMIIEPAHDDAVDVVMTRATRYDDERVDVVRRIEGYLVASAAIPWRLFNNHTEGTVALTLFAPSDAQSPDLGETLFLEDRSEIQPTEGINVQRVVSRTQQTFYDTNGSAFQRDVLILELSRPLQADWEGESITRSTVALPQTQLRTSSVSAGARYYGVKKVESDITAGDLVVNVGNPFSRIVPSTNAESPVADERASLPNVSFTQSGLEDAITVSTGSVSVTGGTAQSFYVGSSVLPGSLTLSGSFSATDNGDGTLSGGGSGRTLTADYATGEISVLSNSSESLSFTITATPAAAVEDSTLTIFVPVSVQGRALNYIRTLVPRPSPGTISVDYKALGRWYRLTDDGNGSLSGGLPGEGGGTVNYATGTVTATLGALPDIGSAVIFSWGTGVSVADATSTIDISRPHFVVTIPGAPVVPGSVELVYTSDGSPVTLTDDLSCTLYDGTDPVGVYNPQNGAVAFRPLVGKWPDGSSSTITYTVDLDTSEQENFTPTPAGASDQVSFTLGHLPQAGSVQLEWVTEVTIKGRLRLIEFTIYDDGAGGLKYANGDTVAGGSIDYATGEVAFPAAFGGG